jgi:hypothetical protein
MCVEYGTLPGLEGINHKCLKVVFVKILENKYAAVRDRNKVLFYVTWEVWCL